MNPDKNCECIQKLDVYNSFKIIDKLVPRHKPPFIFSTMSNSYFSEKTSATTRSPMGQHTIGQMFDKTVTVDKLIMMMIMMIIMSRWTSWWATRGWDGAWSRTRTRTPGHSASASVLHLCLGHHHPHRRPHPNHHLLQILGQQNRKPDRQTPMHCFYQLW